jgi:hypothetical protein
MKVKIDIWTIELTLLLYREIMKRFGPHRLWGPASFPAVSPGAYDDFCEDFARAHGAKSSDAVKMQVGWAIGHQPMIKNLHNMRNFFRNKLVAWDVDFIDSNLFPAWSMNWYRDVSDHIKNVTRSMMETHVYGESVKINDFIEDEEEAPEEKGLSSSFPSGGFMAGCRQTLFILNRR